MERVFITTLTIEHVRHLKNIVIPLSSDKMKHLIFTGKNGSGKTSVLEALACYLREETITRLAALSSPVKLHEGEEQLAADVIVEKIMSEGCRKEISDIKKGIDILFNQSLDEVSFRLIKGEYIFAYYKAERLFQAETGHIEKVELKDKYGITENPGQLFLKYLADLWVTGMLARSNGKYEKADSITLWFTKFQELLRKIFDDSSLELIFEEDTFSFYMKQENKELFNFNTLSSGFAAVLDIVSDIIIRMEKQTNRSFGFNMPGIVLIDEIETHLHIEMQKTILELLTTIFPNIQFIVSTHSPFILSSVSDAVIYDLEKNILVSDGLADIPYGGIVEGYFGVSELSKSLEDKFTRYKKLVTKQELDDNDFEEIAGLEMYLNEIPDYLALDITTEYQRLKMEFETREDIGW